MNVSLAPGRYPDSIREANYFEKVVRNIEKLPGVVAASSTTIPPLEPDFDFPVTPIGGKRLSTNRAGDNGELDAWYRAINTHFFTQWVFQYFVDGRSMIVTGEILRRSLLLTPR